MTSSIGRAAAPAQSFARTDAEFGWRIANPIMCALIGLIAGGWNGAFTGLAAGVGLIAAPYVLPVLFRHARAVLAWMRVRTVTALRELEQRSPSLRWLLRGRP